MTVANYYGDIASYFGQTGATKSQGKAGGAGSSAQQYAGGGSGDSTNIAPTSGNAGWVSASLGLSSSDKSAFATPFSQQFGGITNNQIIDSAGATGAVTTSPIAPITADPSATGGGYAGTIGGVSVNPITLILALMAGLALVFYAKR